MTSPRMPSDWPLASSDEDDTAIWQRPTFFGAPLPAFPADQSIPGLLGNSQSTIRERRPVEAATTEVLEVRRAV
jgi:hypothetical protein